MPEPEQVKAAHTIEQALAGARTYGRYCGLFIAEASKALEAEGWDSISARTAAMAAGVAMMSRPLDDAKPSAP